MHLARVLLATLLFSVSCAVTVFLAASGLGAVKSLRPDATIDPWRDYTWVSQVVGYQLMLVAHPTLPVKTIKDLIALAKARPGQLSYGSSGIGATPHLVGEYFKAAAKVNLVHVLQLAKADAAKIDKIVRTAGIKAE